MAPPEPAPAPKPRTPTRSPGAPQVNAGGLGFVLGVVACGLGAPQVGVPMLVLGALLLSIGTLARLSGNAVPSLNAAFNLAIEGRTKEAERLLDEASATVQLGYVRRVIDLQRGNLAMRRGDLAAARVHVEAAIARPLGVLARSIGRAHVTAATAMRALLRASEGDAEGARADVAAVERAPEATPEALARAAVAEAVVLERGGDRDALGRHLRAKRSLLLDYTVPRERAVVRAYERMLAAPRASVYRKGAAREAEPEGAEPSIADWIAQVAPVAAPFARRARARVDASTAELAGAPIEAHTAVADGGLVRLAELRVTSAPARRPARHYGRMAVIWVLLTLGVLGAWKAEEESTRVRVPVTDLSAVTTGATGALAALVVALLIGVIALLARRNRGYEDRLAAAMRARACGDEGAVSELGAITRTKYAPAVAQAHRELARDAERRGDLARALEHCDAGIAAATANEATRAGLSAMVLPDLVAERALVLAATDQPEKAEAEMAVLRQVFPAYPFMARAELRVGVVGLVRRGQVGAAARLVARASEELPLSRSDDALLALVRAVGVAGGTATADAAQLRRDLREDAEIAGWLRVVAPTLVTELEAARTDGQGDTEPEAADHADEVQRLAEEEALAAEAAPARGADKAARKLPAPDA
jgi:hypothetical protein